MFSIFLLSFAGIPLTSGFIGKWAVFAAAWNGGAEWLVVVAVVISVVAAFFYIRVIVLMFFSEPADGPVTEVIRPGWTTLAAVGVGVVATVALGCSPGRCWTWPSRPASSSAEPGVATVAVAVERDGATEEQCWQNRRVTTAFDDSVRARLERDRDGAAARPPRRTRRWSPRRPSTSSPPAASGSDRCWSCSASQLGPAAVTRTTWSRPPWWSS